MKKLIFTLLLVVLSCCTADYYYYTPEINYSGRLSMQPFSIYYPKISKHGKYAFLKFPQFITIQGEIQGFTQVDHNLFICNNDKEYDFNFKINGRAQHQIDNAHISYGYYLAVKSGSDTTYVESAIYNTSAIQQKKIKLNQGDTLSFHLAARGYLDGITQLDNNLLEIKIKEHKINPS